MKKGKAPRMEAWITPLEVSLLLSIKQQVYISPDDIKQLRRTKRIKEADYRQLSEHLTLYRRSTMASDDAPRIAKKPDSKSEITLDMVVKWLENFPGTVKRLEQAKKHIPHIEAARLIVAEREAKRVLAHLAKNAKTASKTS